MEQKSIKNVIQCLPDETIEMTLKDYFKHFDNTFNTNIADNIDINKLPMLNMAFNNMGEFMYNTSDDKREITHTLLKIQDKLNVTFNEKQRALFDEYEETENISATELARQMIVFGYSIAYQELKEMDALK